MPDRERAEKRTNNDSQNYRGYGQLPDLVRPKLEENITNSRSVTVRWLTLIGPRRKTTTIHRISLVMASWLTLFVSSWNRVAVFLDIIVKIMPSCLVVRGARREVITLDAIAVVMFSCLTLIVSSWNIIEVILDRVFVVMASWLAVRGPCIKL